MGGRLSGMDHTIGYLQQEIYDLQSSMGEQIHGIAGQVEDILTEQNNPVDHFQWEVARYFPDLEEVRLTLSADLKTYTPETQARYRLTWEEADGSTGEAVTDWTAPPLFTACDVQVPLSTYTTAALEIREGDRTQRYDLGPLTSLDPDAFVLFGEQETAPFSVDMGGAVSVTAEHPPGPNHLSFPRTGLAGVGLAQRPDHGPGGGALSPDSGGGQPGRLAGAHRPGGHSPDPGGRGAGGRDSAYGGQLGPGDHPGLQHKLFGTGRVRRQTIGHPNQTRRRRSAPPLGFPAGK